MNAQRIGSFGEALLRALGREEDDKTRLAAVADAAIRKHAPSLRAAADAVERAVRAEGGMMLEILDEAKFTRALIERYTARRARHIGSGLRASGPGQARIDAHHASARPGQQNAASAARGGQTISDAQVFDAPSLPSAALASPGHARRMGAAAGAASGALRKSVLDVLRVNGQPLRAVTAGEALAFAEKSRRDAGTIERICAGLQETRVIGDQITDDEAERRLKNV